MIAWHFFKNKKSFSDLNVFGNDQVRGKIDESLVLHPEHDDFEIVPKKKAPRYQAPVEKEADSTDSMFADFGFDLGFEDEETPTRFQVPEIIQFSVKANAPEGFNGLDLFNAFQIVGLEYGSLKIFERVDANRMVDFGVACMVEPGTFPISNLDTYYCPGVVFFMQPSVLDEPVMVFDDFVETAKLVAIELNGEVLDHERKPLTDATIQLIRQSL